MSEPAFFDTSWLAVRGAADAHLLEALGLSDAREVSWDAGLSAVLGDYWDADASVDACLSRVFAVPVVGSPYGSSILVVRQQQREWTVIVGGWFGDDGTTTRIPDACIVASRLRGEAHAFTTQGQMDWYAWTAAREGTLVRRFVWQGGEVLDHGTPAADERWDDEDAFQEGIVRALASTHAAGPDEVGFPNPVGLLAVTAWGRANGVPSRDLS